jgi:hypothetical protein
MGAAKTLLPLCLLAGLLVMIGLRGIAFLAHLLIPGLILGIVFYFLIVAVGQFRPRG